MPLLDPYIATCVQIIPSFVCLKSMHTEQIVTGMCTEWNMSLCYRRVYVYWRFPYCTPWGKWYLSTPLYWFREWFINPFEIPMMHDTDVLAYFVPCRLNFVFAVVIFFSFLGGCVGGGGEARGALFIARKVLASRLVSIFCFLCGYICVIGGCSFLLFKLSPSLSPPPLSWFIATNWLHVYPLKARPLTGEFSPWRIIFAERKYNTWNSRPVSLLIFIFYFLSEWK